MGKPLFGLILGGVLGIFDGLTALFTPAVRSQIVGIVIGNQDDHRFSILHNLPPFPFFFSIPTARSTRHLSLVASRAASR